MAATLEGFCLSVSLLITFLSSLVPLPGNMDLHPLPPGSLTICTDLQGARGQTEDEVMFQDSGGKSVESPDSIYSAFPALCMSLQR